MWGAGELSQPGILPQSGGGKAGVPRFSVSAAGIEGIWAGLGLMLSDLA